MCKHHFVIWVISTIYCPSIMDSTSSLAIFITSMQKKNPKWTTIHQKKTRGVIHSWATDKDDPAEMRWGKVGKQKIEDTGPLTRKRMETCDDEFVLAAKDFIKRQHKDGKSKLTGPLTGKTIGSLVIIIRCGGAYVNVHTTQNQNGEIRGQIS